MALAIRLNSKSETSDASSHYENRDSSVWFRFHVCIVLVATASNKTESVTVCFKMPNHCCLLLILLDILVVSISGYFGRVDIFGYVSRANIYTVKFGCSGQKGADVSSRNGPMCPAETGRTCTATVCRTFHGGYLGQSHGNDHLTIMLMVSALDESDILPNTLSPGQYYEIVSL
jgi:hypothetical protein